LKKSRVSLRLKRPPLQYEAAILHHLQGNPAIPKLYAYGRFEHFEYIAMELLGSSLGHLQETHGVFPLKTVLRITDQLVCTIFPACRYLIDKIVQISALAYIHRHGLVHRDIKPDNIMQSLENPERICIIDYGITRPFSTGTPVRRDPHVERINIMGTLNWASLNSHYGFGL
jgi:serine/threonine protein kinase